MILTTLYQWKWKAALVRSSEDPKLELPKAWEPLNRSKPSQTSEGTSSRCVFSYGDRFRYKGL